MAERIHKVGRGFSERQAGENTYFFWQEINTEENNKEERKVTHSQSILIA